MTQTIHNTPYLPPLRHVVSSYSAPWYIRIASTIKEIIKKIFSPFFFWKKDKEVWTRKKIEVLNQIKDREFLHRHDKSINNKIKEITRSPRTPSKSIYNTTHFDPPVEIMYKSLTQVIEKAIRKVDEKLSDQLSKTNKPMVALISPLIQNNSSFIATELSGRFAEIFEKINFKSFTDQMIALLLSQVKSYLNAENRVKNQMRANGINSFTSETATNYIYQCLPNTYLSLACTDPKTKSTYKVNKDIDKKTKLYLKNFIDTVFDHIFNEVHIEKNGKQCTIDRLTYIWDQLDIPEPLSRVFKEMEIESEIREVLSKLGPPIVKQILLEYSFSLYKKYSSKEMIMKLFAEIILPTLTEKSLMRHVQNIILHNTEALKPILLNLKNSDHVESVKIELKKKLFSLTKENCTFLKFKEYNITQEYLNEKILNSKIDTILEAITDPSLKEEPIETILDELYKTVHSEQDDRLSELFFDTLLKVGEFEGGLKNIAYWVKTHVNMLLGNMVYPLTKDKYTPIEVLNTLLAKELLEKQDVIVTTQSEISQNEIANEIKKLSSIIYDIGLENAKSSSNSIIRCVKSNALKAILGKDPSIIQKATTKIFNKLFTHPVLNTDLFYKTQNIILDFLNKIS